MHNLKIVTLLIFCITILLQSRLVTQIMNENTVGQLFEKFIIFFTFLAIIIAERWCYLNFKSWQPAILFFLITVALLSKVINFVDIPMYEFIPDSYVAYAFVWLYTYLTIIECKLPKTELNQFYRNSDLNYCHLTCYFL